jgi:hypothetical protein
LFGVLVWSVFLVVLLFLSFLGPSPCLVLGTWNLNPSIMTITTAADLRFIDVDCFLAVC